MNNNWQVHINQEGNLFIKGRKAQENIVTLFGSQSVEYGICIYSHYLRSVKQVLDSLFPHAAIKNLESMEAIIKEEFCTSRSVSIFKSLMDKAGIPYRTYSSEDNVSGRARA